MSGAYDVLTSYLEEHEARENSLTTLKLRSSNLNMSTITPIANRTSRSVMSMSNSLNLSTLASSAIPAEQKSTLVADLEYFVRKIDKTRKLRLHQLRQLQHSLASDLDWEMEFNDAAVASLSLQHNALSEEEYQTLLFGHVSSEEKTLESDINSNENVPLYNDLSTSIKDAFDEFEDVANVSLLQKSSRSRLKQLAFALKQHTHPSQHEGVLDASSSLAAPPIAEGRRMQRPSKAPTALSPLDFKANARYNLLSFSDSNDLSSDPPGLQHHHRQQRRRDALRRVNDHLSHGTSSNVRVLDAIARKDPPSSSVAPKLEEKGKKKEDEGANDVFSDDAPTSALSLPPTSSTARHTNLPNLSKSSNDNVINNSSHNNNVSNNSSHNNNVSKVASSSSSSSRHSVARRPDMPPLPRSAPHTNTLLDDTLGISAISRASSTEILPEEERQEVDAMRRFLSTSRSRSRSASREPASGGGEELIEQQLAHKVGSDRQRDDIDGDDNGDGDGVGNEFPAFQKRLQPLEEAEDEFDLFALARTHLPAFQPSTSPTSLLSPSDRGSARGGVLLPRTPQTLPLFDD